MVAFEQPRSAITLVPAASMEANRYKFGACNSDGNLVLATAATTPVGVIQTPGIIGEPCNVMTDGVSFIMLGGTVAAGAAVEVGANGLAVTLASGKLAGICLVGGVSGAIGSILLK